MKTLQEIKEEEPYRRRQEIYPEIRLDDFKVHDNEREWIFTTWIRKEIDGIMCLCRVKRSTRYNPNDILTRSMLENDRDLFLMEAYKVLVTNVAHKDFVEDTHSQMSEAERLIRLMKITP